MTAVGKRVVVIGGRGRDNSHFADLHIFDTGEKTLLSFSIFLFSSMLPLRLVTEKENRTA